MEEVFQPKEFRKSWMIAQGCGSSHARRNHRQQRER
jgi:hypothetical protein